MPNEGRSRELFYRDGDEGRSDVALHEPILDNREADGLLSQMAIQRALAMGLTLAQAEQLYGLPAEPSSDE